MPQNIKQKYPHLPLQFSCVTEQIAHASLLLKLTTNLYAFSHRVHAYDKLIL